MRIQAFSHSDPGRQRSRNEDRVYCDERERVFVIVDGMGGQAAGEKAAEEAMAAIKHRLGQKTGEVERRIREAIWHANEEIVRLASRHNEWNGMGCVATVAAIEDGDLFVGHVGDTRLYEIRGGNIRKITHDHSPVGVREDAGEISELEAMRHPRRNEVYRDVGSAKHELYDDNFIEFVRRPFYPDAALVLCSDGLSDMVTSEEIRACVEQAAIDHRDAAAELVTLANERGGKDNISVIVVEGEEFSANHTFSGYQEGGNSTRAERRIEGETQKTGLSQGWAWVRYVAILLAGIVLGIGLVTLVPALRPVKMDPGVSLPSQASEDFAVIRVGQGRSFETIQLGMQQAKAGDAIEVDPGVYEGPIELKNGVRLAARHPGTAIIEAEDYLSNPSAAISGKGLRSSSLEGFIVRAKAGRRLAVGIRLTGCEATIMDTEVTGTYLVGVWLEGDSQASLVANRIHDNSGRGLVAEGRSRVTLNHIAKNVVGIEIRPGSEALNISGNIIRGNQAGFVVPNREWQAKAQQQNLVGRNRVQVRVTP